MKCRECGAQMKIAENIAKMIRGNVNVSREQLVRCDDCGQPYMMLVKASSTRLTKVTPKWLRRRSKEDQVDIKEAIERMKIAANQNKLSRAWAERL